MYYLCLYLQVKEETILHNFKNRHEIPCSENGSPHSINNESKRTVTTSVILQPVTHDESLLSSTVIDGHQYSASSVLVNQPVCSPTSIKVKSETDIERLPSPTSVSLVTTIASTRLATATANSSPLMCNNTSSSEQIVPSAR